MCEPIRKHEFNTYKKLGKQMVKYIKNPENGGIGLAAPQIGINKRIIVCGIPVDKSDENYAILLMYNPEITEVGDQKDVFEEGCLSLPGVTGNVERPTSVTVEYQDEKGKKMKRSLEWFWARVVQHEIDHINGILFIDKLFSTPK